MNFKLVFFLLIFTLAIVFAPDIGGSTQPAQALVVSTNTSLKPVSFSVSDLTIKPANPNRQCDIYNLGTDEEIIVSVTVTNNGSSRDSHEVVLYVDWEEVETKSITLNAGDSQNIDFNLLWGTNEDGIYTVTIEELHAIFGVG
jgi:hypothetical protein